MSETAAAILADGRTRRLHGGLYTALLETSARFLHLDMAGLIREAHAL